MTRAGVINLVCVKDNGTGCLRLEIIGFVERCERQLVEVLIGDFSGGNPNSKVGA